MLNGKMEDCENGVCIHAFMCKSYNFRTCLHTALETGGVDQTAFPDNTKNTQEYHPITFIRNLRTELSYIATRYLCLDIACGAKLML